jgi:hypothetical protein
MNLIGNTIAKTLRILPRAALIGMMLAAPVLAVPSLAGQRDAVIEARRRRRWARAWFF